MKQRSLKLFSGFIFIGLAFAAGSAIAAPSAHHPGAHGKTTGPTTTLKITSYPQNFTLVTPNPAYPHVVGTSEEVTVENKGTVTADNVRFDPDSEVWTDLTITAAGTGGLTYCPTVKPGDTCTFTVKANGATGAHLVVAKPDELAIIADNATENPPFVSISLNLPPLEVTFSNLDQLQSKDPDFVAVVDVKNDSPFGLPADGVTLEAIPNTPNTVFQNVTITPDIDCARLEAGKECTIDVTAKAEGAHWPSGAVQWLRVEGRTHVGGGMIDTAMPAETVRATLNVIPVNNRPMKLVYVPAHGHADSAEVGVLSNGGNYTGHYITEVTGVDSIDTAVNRLNFNSVKEQENTGKGLIGRSAAPLTKMLALPDGDILVDRPPLAAGDDGALVPFSHSTGDPLASEAFPGGKYTAVDVTLSPHGDYVYAGLKSESGLGDILTMSAETFHMGTLVPVQLPNRDALVPEKVMTGYIPGVHAYDTEMFLNVLAQKYTSDPQFEKNGYLLIYKLDEYTGEPTLEKAIPIGTHSIAGITTPQYKATGKPVVAARVWALSTWSNTVTVAPQDPNATGATHWTYSVGPNPIAMVRSTPQGLYTFVVSEGSRPTLANPKGIPGSVTIFKNDNSGLNGGPRIVTTLTHKANDIPINPTTIVYIPARTNSNAKLSITGFYAGTDVMYDLKTQKSIVRTIGEFPSSQLVVNGTDYVTATGGNGKIFEENTENFTPTISSVVQVVTPHILGMTNGPSASGANGPGTSGAAWVENCNGLTCSKAYKQGFNGASVIVYQPYTSYQLISTKGVSGGTLIDPTTVIPSGPYNNITTGPATAGGSDKVFPPAFVNNTNCSVWQIPGRNSTDQCKIVQNPANIKWPTTKSK